MRLHWIARGGLAGAAFAALALAQTFPLQIVGTSNGQVATIPNGAQIPFAASVGQSQILQVSATYAGSGKISITQQPQVIGSTEFTAPPTLTLPVTLNPGDTLSFDIVFRPASATEVSAIFTLPFTETVAGSGSGNPPPVVTANAINLTLLGSAASFVVSYTKDQNVIQLATGGIILFDPQPINTSVTLPVNITNNGSATGNVNNITVSNTSGKAFQLVARPLLPTGIPAGESLPVGIEYTPIAVETDTGQLQITYGDGSTASFALQGSGTSPMLVYTLTENGKNTTVTPPGPIALPNTNVGSTSTVVVRVQNTGNGTATVNNLSVNSANGAVFQISGGPILPKTLSTSDSFNFTLTFAPTQPGPVTGQLLVGSDLFNLTGNGLGSNLQFSYVSAGSTLTIGTNGVSSVVFSPVQVTKTESIPFTVKNTGTLPAVVSNIAVQGANSPYSISGGPALPKSLAAGASFSFTLNFAPATATVVSDTLLINTTSVPLIGQGTAPPALPAYTISGPSGTVAPQTQPSVTLTLASPYPVEIDGVLTLTTSGTLGSDPAVQFTNGLRTVPFTIPANSTAADFASQGNQILLQTGTVASTILLTPTFTTAAGGVSLTPTNPPTLQFTVPAEAPVLIGVTATTNGSNSIVLVFTGYSTTRALSSLNVQFTAAAGFTLSASQVTVDLSQAAAIWFGSSASQGFGGQFTVTVPFTFSGTPPTGTALVQTIASVSATISNGVGASNAVTSPIE
jgi:hypothetical protein